MGILDEIRQRILFFDGGMGSLLQANGLKPGELPETWNMTHPELLQSIHREYLEAGCDVVTTNTFGANGLKFPGKSCDYGVTEIVTAAVSHAKAAVNDQGRGYVALDLGPTGKLLKPLGDLGFDQAYELYKEVVLAGVDAGADLILVETMSDGYEAKAAVLAAKENSSLPVFVTMIFDEKGKLLTGGDVHSAVALLEGLGVDALGVNCGLGPVQMKEIVRELAKTASVPIVVNPNAGLPHSEGGRTVYDINADEFAAEMEELISLGACAVGGCCGTTPEHIKKTVERCRKYLQKLPDKKTECVISSYAHAVVIGEEPVIIGERINPTGKSKFKQALLDHNLEYILREAVTQQEHGAHVLDVNVGLPGIDEAAMMEDVVKEVQSIVDLPLQIDTSDLKAMERAMRIYNGKPLINSVNGKEESMNAVFPLVKKYGGVVVALALDEEGIPETAEGRIAIAKKIYGRAAEYGIEKKDILIDALCLTVSSDSRGALTTLETVRRVKEELGGKTILGVSNISFGLPQRENINASFFTMALLNGLDAAIINPNSEAMMRTYFSFRALADMDPQCGDYIRVYGGQAAAAKVSSAGPGASSAAPGASPAAPGASSAAPRASSSAPGASSAGASSGSSSGLLPDGISPAGSWSAASNATSSLRETGRTAYDMTVRDYVIRGLKDGAREAVAALLETKDALAVVNEEMIPALDVVGKGFERGTIFLPQLLMSAEAAKAAFEVIKDRLALSGETEQKKGKIILATVKGDIHDIGKNIVKVLLENYSYDVIDLGKDVPPELIVENAVKEQVQLVGLSALMTTTVPGMEETIRQLREKAPWAKVMVGGAVLTEEYARTIGADCYCKDAMASVNYAESLFFTTEA